MGNALNRTVEYRDWLKDLKLRVRQAQLKAAVQVNSALLMFYWELGADIVERQKSAKWGSGFLRQLSVDLMAEFPDMKGFSKRNFEGRQGKGGRTHLVTPAIARPMSMSCCVTSLSNVNSG